MILDLNEWKQNQQNQKLIQHCREFDDYYEYCMIDDYEDKFAQFHVHSVQVGEVFAGILEEQGKHVLVSIQFFKSQFSLTRIGKWMDEMSIFFLDSQTVNIQIPNCSKMLDGVCFQGRPVVAYQKGHRTLDVDMSGCIEVSDVYQSYDLIVNSANAKDVELGDPCKVTIFLNGQQVYQVPKIQFDIPNGDLIICNGMVIVADLIEDYCGTVGFTQSDNALLPVTFFHDDDTPIYIDIHKRENGSKLCIVRQDSTKNSGGGNEFIARP